MLAGRIAVVVSATLLLSACEDATWERLTTFPNYSKPQVQPDAAPPVPPPADIVSTPAPAPSIVQGAQAPVVAEPETPPPAIIVASPAAAGDATSADYCRRMADSAGKNAAMDGFDGAGQQNVVDTTLRQCRTFYGK